MTRILLEPLIRLFIKAPRNQMIDACIGGCTGCGKTRQSSGVHPIMLSPDVIWSNTGHFLKLEA